MEFKDFSSKEIEEETKRDFASLIKRCDDYMLSHPNSKIWVRDTDHTYAFIRLETENVPTEDRQILTSLCPKCGSVIQVTTCPSEHFEDYGLTFCDYCYATTEENGWQKLVRLLHYLNRVDDKKERSSSIFNFISKKLFGSKQTYSDTHLSPKTHQLDAEHFRIRVWTSLNKLLYVTLNRIRLNENGELYIEHGNDKSDIVKFAGVILKGRDKYGKRLFQGDIIRFIFDSGNGEKRETEAILKSWKLDNNSIRYIVEDNIYSNFPPAPEWIDNDTIEVIGNIFENPDFEIGNTKAKEFSIL